MPHQEPETAAACADARSCLRALRENLMQLLLEHNVEPVHDVDSLSPEERLNLAEPPPSENGEASGRVRRVGFIYHDPVEDEGDTHPPNSRRAG